jgi:ketosteroid isomerase-like protein
MTHPNEQLVRDGFAALADGDMDAMRRVLADDVAWHLPGRSLASGSHHGVDQVIGYLGRLMELSGGTFAVDLHDVVGNDRHVFAAYGITARRDGKALNDRVLVVFHVRDGKVTEGWWAVGDQYLFDDFWS